MKLRFLHIITLNYIIITFIRKYCNIFESTKSISFEYMRRTGHFVHRWTGRLRVYNKDILLTCNKVGVIWPVFGDVLHWGLLAFRRGDGGDLFAVVGRMIGGGVDVNWHRFRLEFLSCSIFQFSSTSTFFGVLLSCHETSFTSAAPVGLFIYSTCPSLQATLALGSSKYRMINSYSGEQGGFGSYCQ